jgi:hypothetical protein
MDDVAAEVARFDPEDTHYWKVFTALVAEDPSARSGQYVERLIPVQGMPLHTYIYWIIQSESAGAERIFTFTAEFFDRRPVYLVNEDAAEILVISIRDRWTYDPI